jgi:hypothetical protein
MVTYLVLSLTLGVHSHTPQEASNLEQARNGTQGEPVIYWATLIVFISFFSIRCVQFAVSSAIHALALPIACTQQLTHSRTHALTLAHTHVRTHSRTLARTHARTHARIHPQFAKQACSSPGARESDWEAKENAITSRRTAAAENAKPAFGLHMLKKSKKPMSPSNTNSNSPYTDV